MTSEPSENHTGFGSGSERRIHNRVHVQFDRESVIYAELGGGRFGIITNISEGGLAMQTVNPVVTDDLSNLCFRLSSAGNLIRPNAHVAWKTISKRMAGVQFLSMSTAERIELRNWIHARLPLELEKQSRAPVVVSIGPAERKREAADAESDRLQQLLAERTTDHEIRRKLLQWTVVVILASVLVASLLTLWYLLAYTR